MRRTTLIIAALFILGNASAIAANTDELWEITNSVKMQGMSMPSSTQTSCLAKNQPYEPEQEDKNCTVFDVKVAGNKTSWKVRCTGEDAMVGTGVMTRTASTLNGVMTMETQGEKMTMKMSGRVVGKCDAVAERKKTDGMIADAEAKQAEAMAQLREQQRKGCEETRKMAASNFGNYESFKQHEGSKNGMGGYLAKCKVNLEASRKKLCAKASVEEHESVKKHCPDEYAAMRLQHCTGRGGSYQELCDGTSSQGRDGASAGADNANPAKSVLDGAKGLMNIFKF